MTAWNWEAAIDGARQDKAARDALAATRLTRPEPVFSREMTAAGKRFHARIGRLTDRTANGARCRNFYARQETPVNATVTQLPAVADDVRAIMAPVVLSGDTSNLTAPQKMDYLMGVCRTVGVNPMTQPFMFVKLQGKEVLYATRTCTDQLRTLHGISLEILSEEIKNGLIVVKVRATNAQGRSDTDVGVVSVTYPKTYRDRSGQVRTHPQAGQIMEGEDYANALMKATTKAKRRVTLSLCGLGWLDETEVASVQQAEIDLSANSAAPAELPAPAKPVRTFALEGVEEGFPSTVRGFEDALAVIEGDLPRLVLLNQHFLDRLLGISGKKGVPDYTGRINDIRARARQALTPAHAEPDMSDLTDEALGIPDDLSADSGSFTNRDRPVSYDPETGERVEPEPDRIAQRVAVRRGSAPSDDGPAPGDVSALE